MPKLPSNGCAAPLGSKNTWSYPERETPLRTPSSRWAIGMIMLGSARDDEFGTLQTTPEKVGGVGTQSPYIIVADADAHHARAARAGADVVRPVRDEDYGGRGYSCRDLEGHLWNFGTYDPWPSE